MARPSIIPTVKAALEEYLERTQVAYLALSESQRMSTLPATSDGKVNVRLLAAAIGLKQTQEKYLYERPELTSLINLVAEGRGMTPDAVDKIAQGRVWSGRDAKELGLVDELGSLDTAIKSAAALAELKQYQVMPVEAELSTLEQLLRQIFNKASQVVAPKAMLQLNSLLEAGNKTLAPLQRLDDPRGQYALSPVTAP